MGLTVWKYKNYIEYLNEPKIQEFSLFAPFSGVCTSDLPACEAGILYQTSTYSLLHEINYDWFEEAVLTENFLLKSWDEQPITRISNQNFVNEFRAP